MTEANIRKVLKGGMIATKPATERAGPSEEVVAYRLARLKILVFLKTGEGDKALASITDKEGSLSGTDPADPDLLRGMVSSTKGDRKQSLAHYRKAENGLLFRSDCQLHDPEDAHGFFRDEVVVTR